MKGYFTRLARQSSIAIGASGPSVSPRPGPLPRIPPDGAGAAPHFETIDLVDSLPPAGAVGLPRPEAAGQPRPNDSKSFSGSEQAGRQVAAADVLSPSIGTSSEDSNKQIAELSETSLFIQGSTSSPAIDVAGSSSNALEKQSRGQGGVVRVGGRGSEQQRAPEADSFTEVAGAISRREPATRSEYLEGIREWLALPPVESAATVQDQADRSAHSNSVDRKSAEQTDVQEFSLSIGSISIVVEEPPPQPNQRSNSVQPVQGASVSPQPRARDAFALSRNYFRGF